MLTGENGILTQATRAKEETERAQENQETTIGQYESYINKVTGNNAEVGKIVTDGNKPYTNNGTAIIPEGFMIVPGCEDVSQGLVISDNSTDTEIDDTNIVAEGNQFVWIPVTEETQYIRKSDYEFTVLSAQAYTDNGYLPEGIQPTISSFITEEREIGKINEQAEREAVMRANGFYISRYEAGKEGTDTLVTKRGKTVWTNITHSNCKQKAKEFIPKYNPNIKSGLCSGIQWDVIMEFVDGKLDGSGKDIFDVKIPNTSRHINNGFVNISGQNISDKVCNIYDLEGNALEYVAEKTSYNNNNNFIRRGGYYTYQANAPASIRDSIANEEENLAASFRIVLYINI